MGVVLDIIILGFIIISGFIGYKKGLAKIAISIIGVVLALVLAFMLKGSVASFIEQKTNISSGLKTTISDGINAAIKNKVDDDAQNNQNGDTDDVNSADESASNEENKENLEGDDKETNDNKKINSFYLSLVEKMDMTGGIDIVADKVVKFILETASFIVIFFVVYLCVFIIKMMLNIVCKLPILAQINGIGGLVASTLISIIQVWVVLAILSFLSPMMPQILVLIDTTYVTRLLYNINLIVIILSSGLKF